MKRYAQLAALKQEGVGLNTAKPHGSTRMH